MPNKPTTVLFILLLWGILPVNAQDPATAVLAEVGNGTADQVLADTQEHVEVNASSDSSSVYIRIGSSISKASEPDDPSIGADFSRRVAFTTWNLTASAPLDKDDDLTDFANQDGLANGFKLELGFTRFSAVHKSVPNSRAQALCEKMREEAIDKGLTKKEAEDLLCEAGNFGQYSPDLLDEWEQYFWGSKESWNREKYMRFWGASAAVGHQEFGYLDGDSLEKLDETQTPWSAKVYLSLIPARIGSLFTLGLEYQDTYEAADSKTLCPNDDDEDVLECKTGAVGAPEKKEKELAFFNWRWQANNGRIGLSMLLTFDFESDVFGVDLPIFFARDEDKSLTGGVRLGWRDDTEDLKIGVFVGKSFSLIG